MMTRAAAAAFYAVFGLLVFPGMVSAWISTDTHTPIHHHGVLFPTAEDTRTPSRLIRWTGTSISSTSTTLHAQLPVSPVMAAYELDAQARDLQEQGSLNSAVEAFRKAALLHPTPDRYFKLAEALQENGEPSRAIESYKTVRNSGADPALRHLAALRLAHVWAHDLGEVSKAITYSDAAMAEPGYAQSAAAQDQKALFLADQWNLQDAIGHWSAALEGGHAVDMGEGVDDDARFFRAVAKALAGRRLEAEADLAALPAERQYMVDSWRYVDAHFQKQQGVVRAEPWHCLFSGTYYNLQTALAAARPDGLVCEFGVFHGKSIRLIAAMVGDQVPVDGFDTFEGLPEVWGPEAAGTYTAASDRPDVPDHVRFHVGLFADTLPGYVESLAPSSDLPVRFLNVDCDLYQGTVEVFHYLADRIGPGAVIAFDEYLMHPTWPQDEYKAFQEACDKFGWEYEYLSFSLFSKQVVVRITASASFVGTNPSTN